MLLNMDRRRYRPPTGIDPYGQLIHKGLVRKGECLLAQVTLSTNGYRYMQRSKRVLYAHRVAFEKWHRSLLSGEVVDHTCHNEAAHAGLCEGGVCFHRQCVNPARAGPFHGVNGTTKKRNC